MLCYGQRRFPGGVSRFQAIFWEMGEKVSIESKRDASAAVGMVMRKALGIEAHRCNTVVVA